MGKPKKVRIVPFEQSDGKWSWHAKINGRVQFGAHQPFASKGNAVRAAERVAELMPTAVVGRPELHPSRMPH